MEVNGGLGLMVKPLSVKQEDIGSNPLDHPSLTARSVTAAHRTFNPGGAGSNPAGRTLLTRSSDMATQRVYDFDARWLEGEAKRARTVGEVISRYDQYQNKIRALKLRYAREHDLYGYGARMEAFVSRLKRYAWNELLTDIRREDVIIRSLKV